MNLRYMRGEMPVIKGERSGAWFKASPGEELVRPHLNQ
jgi:hypothetical protein